MPATLRSLSAEERMSEASPPLFSLPGVAKAASLRAASSSSLNLAPSLRAKSSSNLNLCESAAEGSAPPAADDEDSGFEELTVTPSKANNGANGEAESAEPGTVTPQ